MSEKVDTADSTLSNREGAEDVTPSLQASERRLVLKCDIHVVAVLFCLYLISFLDRINLGNARIQKLEEELGMKGNDFNVALLVFFIGYILCEIPSNILLRRFRPSTWLSCLMFLWGIVTVCQGLTQSFAGLVVCRALLGVFEAGFLPGSIYIISMYYKRHEVQKRGTAFFISGLVAGAFGGLLAYALAKMDGIGNYSGWRWIFIIEGLLTIVVAIISKWLIADWPETAKFLNESEKALLKRRLEDSGSIGHMDSLTRDAARKIFKDWKIWICTAMYFCLVTSGYSTAFFIPTILEEFGYTASRAQVLTIPIYMANVPVALLAAFLADWFQHRYFFSMVGVVLSCMGYTILLAQGGLPVGVKYMAIFFVVGGIYITQPIVMLWMVGNLGGHYKRAFGTAMQIGIGNLGGILGSTIYVQREKPRYFTGYSVALALFVACGVLCTIFFLALAAENRKRDRGERNDRYGLPRKELENLGDDHPSFRFTL